MPDTPTAGAMRAAEVVLARFYRAIGTYEQIPLDSIESFARDIDERTCLPEKEQYIDALEDSLRGCAVAIKMLLQHTPVQWSDHVEDGQLSLLVNADSIDSAEDALAQARTVLPHADAPGHAAP